jgi:divalent metal cation (Fe/Co/Zn/Cd) transporter
VETRVAGSIGAGDVIVHVDPVRHADESPSQTVGAAAGRLGLRVHNVHAHELQGQYFLDFHVEVPPELTLAQAHERVGQLETAVRAELPYVDDIHTHIEPMAVSVSAAALEQEEDDRLRGQIFEVVRGVAGLHSCHKLFVRPSPHGYDIVLHCLADPELPVAEAHRLADQAEKELQAQVPGIGQVLIRVEPEGGS